MLRSGGTTYVCDVNGFSFVKSSDNYYVDCAYKLKRMIYDKLNIKHNAIPRGSESDSVLSSRPYRPSQKQTGP